MFRFLQDVSIFPCVAWELSQFETMRKKKKTYRHLESPQEQWLVVKMLRAFSPHLSECQQLSLYSPLFVPHSCTDRRHFWGPGSKQEVLLLQPTPGSGHLQNECWVQ